MMTFDDLKKVQSTFEAELFDHPGVHGVGIGYKTTANVQTDQLAIIVLVDAKLDRSVLNEAELIPAQVGGVPTDVVQYARHVNAIGVMDQRSPAAATINNGRYRPLIGGSAISVSPPTRTLPPGQYEYGTLGGFASTGSNSVLQFSVGVSCNHVLGDVIAPKRWVQQPYGSENVSEVNYSVFDAPNGVDAAGFSGLVAGEAYSNDVLNLGAVAGSYILQLSDLNKTVVKSGATSLVTSGSIWALNVTAFDGNVVMKNLILITGAFCDHGDSGSLVLLPTADPTAFLAVGLLQAKSPDALGPQSGAAAHIGSVMSALNIVFPAPPVSQ